MISPALGFSLGNTISSPVGIMPMIGFLYTSIYLGPLYGGVVGGFGDLFGALLFPKGDINWFIEMKHGVV